jgi:hypothetical protein
MLKPSTDRSFNSIVRRAIQSSALQASNSSLVRAKKSGACLRGITNECRLVTGNASRRTYASSFSRNMRSFGGLQKTQSLKFRVLLRFDRRRRSQPTQLRGHWCLGRSSRHGYVGAQRDAQRPGNGQALGLQQVKDFASWLKLRQGLPVAHTLGHHQVRGIELFAEGVRNQ